MVDFGRPQNRGGFMGTGTGERVETFPGTNVPAERVSWEQVLADPNLQRMLASLGGGISQGQPFGQAAGSATQEFVKNLAMQKAAAEQSQQQQGILQAIVNALKGDPTGKNLLGPKEDLNTLDSITVTNDGINIKAPNPSKTSPYQNLSDQAIESQTAQRPRGSVTRSPMAQEPSPFPFF